MFVCVCMCWARVRVVYDVWVWLGGEEDNGCVCVRERGCMHACSKICVCMWESGMIIDVCVCLREKERERD